MDISVVLPTYLEAENLKRLLPKINAVINQMKVDYEVLVIDTVDSMDDTEMICEMNNVAYHHRIGGNMYGDAIRTGIALSKGKYVVFMDADGSHNPEDIFRLYNAMVNSTFDVIIGSRYCKGGYTDNNFILRFMSWVLNLTYRMLFGLKVKDVSDSFRIYDGSKLRNLVLECNNFDIVEEILIKWNYSASGMKVNEIPISFNKREAGDSKRDLIKFILSYMTTIRKLLAIKRRS